MKVYLINLDRAHDRLQFMSQAFAQAGMQFTRVSAVDGKELSEDQIRNVVSEQGYWGWLTPGEVGCFLSHRSCWEEIVKADEPYGVIFEDDVLLAPDAGRILEESAWIPHDADIVKLETAGSRIYLDRWNSAEIDARLAKRLRSSHYCTGGYIISVKAARRLLHESQNFSDAIDDFLFSSSSRRFHTLAIYQMVPAICVQEAISHSAKIGRLGSGIEGRERKTMKQLSFGERAKLVAFKESQSAINKLLTLLGKRERIVVEFK